MLETIYWTRKKHLKPDYKRVQMLTTDVEKPADSDGNEDRELEMKRMQYDIILSEIRNILNVVLPSSFSTDYSINQSLPSKIWRDLNRRYGVTTSVSIGKTLTAFDLSTCNPSYRDVDHLMEQSRKSFNTLNSELRQLLGLSEDVQPIREEILSIHVLRCLPQEKASAIPASKPKDFKVERMFTLIKQHVVASSSEHKVNNVGVKRGSKGKAKVSKARVNNVISKGKRKFTENTSSSSSKACFYCFSPDHFKNDCPTRAKDREVGIYKMNVNSRPSKVPATAEQKKAIAAASKPKGMPIKTQVSAILAETEDRGTPPREYVGTPVPLTPTPPPSPSLFTPEVEPVQAEVITNLYNNLDKYVSNKLWVIDTGAGKSITGYRSMILKHSRTSENLTEFITPLPGASSCSEFKGIIKFNVLTNLGSLNCVINDVHYVPNWENNILSLYALRCAGFTLVESNNPKYLLLKKDDHLIVAREIAGVYYLQTRPPQSELISHAQETMIKDPALISKALKDWHLKLGHLNKQSLIKLISKRLVEGLPFVPSSLLNKVPFFCKVCAESKHNRMTYKNKTGSRPDKFFHTIHSDTMQVEIPGTYGNLTKIKYIQNFVDDYSSYKWIFLETSIGGNKTLENLKKIQAKVKNSHDLNLKVFRSDNGTEYINKTLTDHLNQLGIEYEESNVECKEENGSSERYNQTLMNYVRCMLLGSGMPKRFWPEAAMYAHYILNRLPTRRLQGKSPYEMATKLKPNLGKLPIWGTACFAHVPANNRPHKKLASRATRCRFLGLDSKHKDAFRLYNLETRSIFVSRDVRFNTTFTDHLHNRSFASEEPLITSEELQDLLTQASLTSELTGSAGAIPTDHDAQTTQTQSLASGGGNNAFKTSRSSTCLDQSY